MPTKFIAAPIPGGADYASFQEVRDGITYTVVVADPAVLARLAANPETIGIAYELCGAVLTGLESSPNPAPRLRSVA